MPDKKPDVAGASQLRQRALSRWENEGGATLDDDLINAVSAVPELTNAELVQLRIRVIALENLMIALLAEASDRQIDLAREMATYISPRPGFTQHSLTTHASAQMIDLVERANQCRTSPPSPMPLNAPRYSMRTRCLLRREHRTKPDVWGVIRILDGRVR
jgi:hypothetical protein